eukprot:1635391-Amphidinium_carterae.1
MLDSKRISPQKFVGTLHKRWGNSIDIVIAAHMMQKNIQLVDIRTAKPILTVKAGDKTAKTHQIGYSKYHFVVGCTRKEAYSNGVVDELLQAIKKVWRYFRQSRAEEDGVPNEVHEGAGQQLRGRMMKSDFKDGTGATQSWSAGDKCVRN